MKISEVSLLPRLLTFGFPVVVFLIASALFQEMIYDNFAIAFTKFSLNYNLDRLYFETHQIVIGHLFLCVTLLYLMFAVCSAFYAGFVIWQFETPVVAGLFILFGLSFGFTFAFLLIGRNEIGEVLVRDVMSSAMSSGLIISQDSFLKLDRLLLIKDRIALPAGGVVIAALACLSGQEVYQISRKVYRMHEIRLRLNILITIGGVFFFLNIISLMLHVRWTLPLFSVVDLREADNLRLSIGLYWGVLSGLAFASAYVPAYGVLIHGRRKAYLSNAGKGQSEIEWYRDNGLSFGLNDVYSRMIGLFLPVLGAPLVELAFLS